jgi:hypothetical protein
MSVLNPSFEVFTEDLCHIFGGCHQCPAYARSSECGLAEEAGGPDEIVFYVHWCHEESERGFLPPKH